MNERLYSLNIVDGFSGLDFSESSFFRTEMRTSTSLSGTG